MSVSLPLAGGRIVSTELPALVMGILNVTDDSFWEGSRVSPGKDSLDRAFAMIEAGADILDIGGESTRPGARYVSAEEEITRIIPLIAQLRKESAIPVSVDTRKAAVLRAALDAGADMVNDISALEDDPSMAETAATADIPVILMHKRGTPDTMQEDPYYKDVLQEVSDYLFSRAQIARKAGIRPDKIILDPGIGFGKNREHNIALISGLAKIVSGGYPVLMALSRKRVIGQITGRDTAERLAGTIAANMIAVQHGAKLLRVHDVAETCDMLKVVREADITWSS